MKLNRRGFADYPPLIDSEWQALYSHWNAGNSNLIMPPAPVLVYELRSEVADLLKPVSTQAMPVVGWEIGHSATILQPLIISSGSCESTVAKRIDQSNHNSTLSESASRIFTERPVSKKRIQQAYSPNEERKRPRKGVGLQRRERPSFGVGVDNTNGKVENKLKRHQHELKKKQDQSSKTTTNTSFPINPLPPPPPLLNLAAMFQSAPSMIPTSYYPLPQTVMPHSMGGVLPTMQYTMMGSMPFPPTLSLYRSVMPALTMSTSHMMAMPTTMFDGAMTTLAASPQTTTPLLQPQ